MNVNLKSFLLNIYFGNQYIVNWLTRKENKDNNIKIENWKNEFSNIDSITDIDDFKKTVHRYIEDSQHPQYELCEGKESLLYGHIQMLYDYAGKKYRRPIYLSKIEHGINFYESASCFQFLREPSCYIFQGNYKQTMAKKLGVTVPVYSIGPFIHYAKPYYDCKRFEEIKKEWKKTLLIFPAHTYELSKCKYDAEQFVYEVFSKYADEYDTVIVCAYWLDLDNIVYKLFQNRGAFIVSAGARFDPNFIRRLKSIIQLSDTVLVNDIGTNIGYAMYMQKPIIMMPILLEKHDVVNDDELLIYKKNEKMFLNAFIHNDQAKKEELYHRFWGGEECIKTPEQILKIIISSERRVKLCAGNTYLYRFIR